MTDVLLSEPVAAVANRTKARLGLAGICCGFLIITIDATIASP